MAAKYDDKKDNLEAGDVGYASAASYFFGYIKIIIPGLRERAEAIQIVQTQIFPKRFICIVPKSCECPDRFLDADNKIQTEHGKIEHCEDIAGKKGRQYLTHIHMMPDGNDKGGEIRFMGEFCAPLKTFVEMSRENLLTREQLNEQRVCFHETLQNLINKANLTDRVKILLYNDDEGAPKLSEQILTALGDDDVYNESIENRSAPKHCGSIGNGMAWNYYFGYLKIVLPGLQQRAKTSLSENYSEPLMKTFVCIIPRMDAFPESFNVVDSKIVSVHPIKFEQDMAGHKNRPYYTAVQKVTPTAKPAFLCLAEFCTPVRTLYEMFSQKLLKQSELFDQIDICATTLTQIIEKKFDNNPNIVIEIFDKTKGSLSELMTEVAHREMVNEVPNSSLDGLN